MLFLEITNVYTKTRMKTMIHLAYEDMLKHVALIFIADF
jgi:hypothetical protein